MYSFGISVKANHSIYPNLIKIGNRLENGYTVINFDIDQSIVGDYQYFIISDANDNTSVFYQINDNAVTITSSVLQDGGQLFGNVVVTSEPIGDTINMSAVTYISDTILLFVGDNYINLNSLNNGGE